MFTDVPRRSRLATRKSAGLVLLLAGLLLSSINALRAGDVPDLGTDRPGQGDATALAAPGWLQVESGLTFSRELGSGTRSDTWTGPVALIRFGLVDAFEIRLATNTGHWSTFTADDVRETDFYKSRVEASVKWRVLEQRGALPTVVLLVRCGTPTGDAGIAENGWAPGLSVPVSLNLPHGFSLGGSAALSWPEPEAGFGRRANLDYALSVGKSLGRGVGAFGEWYGTAASRQAGVNGFDAGLTLALGKNWQLDVSAGGDAGGGATSFFVSAGLCFRLPLHPKK